MPNGESTKLVVHFLKVNCSLLSTKTFKLTKTCRNTKSNKFKELWLLQVVQNIATLQVWWARFLLQTKSGSMMYPGALG